MLVYSQYNMLPKFEKLTVPIFMPTSRLREKQEEGLKYPLAEIHDCPYYILDKISKFICLSTNRYWDETCPTNIYQLAMELREDIVIHRQDGDRDWTAFVHAAFPNGWTPSSVIGKSFYKIHEPVPGFNLSTSKQMVDACIHKGPFQRFVWGVDFDHQHRISANYKQLQFDINNPILYVKVETQIIVGMPEVDAFMFVLRQDFIPEFAIHKPTLLSSLLSMTPEQRVYKSVSDDLLTYLDI